MDAARRANKNDQNLQYMFCYLRRVGSSPGDSPFVMLHDIPASKRYNTWEEAEATMSEDQKKPMAQLQNGNRTLFKSLDLNKAYSDRANNRVLVMLSLDAGGIGKVRDLTFTHIGSERMIALHCYEVEKKFEVVAPAFESISESFQYDDGYSFQPGSTPQSISSNVNLKPLVWLAFLLGAMAIYICRRR
jgi:hypothetical protein